MYYSKADNIDMITPNLYMSDVFNAENYDLLQKLHITHIVTVSRTISPKFPKDFTYLVCEVDDESTQDVG